MLITAIPFNHAGLRDLLMIEWAGRSKRAQAMMDVFTRSHC
jgi:hypothetical protein